MWPKRVWGGPDPVFLTVPVYYRDAEPVYSRDSDPAHSRDSDPDLRSMDPDPLPCM